MRARLSAFALCFLLLITLPSAVAQQPPRPCERDITDQGQVATQGTTLISLGNRLYTAYESGDKREEEDLTKQLLAYSKHSEPAFSDEDKNKMEEIAQRPEIKALIESNWAFTRLKDTNQAHWYHLHDCFFYPNPMLEDYVDRLGQSLVPKNSSEFYAFYVANDPRPGAWTLSTGSVYVSTGLVATVDNEAQLAYVLAHEIGHVELRHAYLQNRGEILEHMLAAEKIRSAKKKGAIIGGIAGGIGGAFGGGRTAAVGALGGAALGYGIADVIAESRYAKFTDFNSAQEAAADEFAMHAVLERNFDAREAPKVFAALENSVRRDSRTGMGFAWGSVDSLVDRRQHVQALLNGALKADLEQRSKTGLQTTSPNFSLLMSEVKRDNGALALKYDLFDEARTNLEEAVSIRSTDPTTHYYLGEAYKRTARSDDESKKALDHFMQAIRLDGTRYAYYNPHLEHALTLINQNDPSVLPDAQKEIKTYIDLYKLNHGGETPPNMYILYDILTLTGDTNWSALPVTNVAQTEGAPSPGGTETTKEAKKADTTKDVVKKTSLVKKDK